MSFVWTVHHLKNHPHHLKIKRFHPRNLGFQFLLGRKQLMIWRLWTIYEHLLAPSSCGRSLPAGLGFNMLHRSLRFPVTQQAQYQRQPRNVAPLQSVASRQEDNREWWDPQSATEGRHRCSARLISMQLSSLRLQLLGEQRRRTNYMDSRFLFMALNIYHVYNTCAYSQKISGKTKKKKKPAFLI